jgi:RNA polymerase sigma-70 factor (ECF subfamily)
MSICVRYTGSNEDAKEAMNDGFMKVFQNLKKYDESRPFLPWLKKILIRSAIDRFHKHKPKTRNVDLEAGMDIVEPERTYDEITYNELLQMVQKLPPVYRAVFNLRAIEGYKHSEIARMLNISEGTSKSNYARAREKLKKYLESYFKV